MAKTSLGLDAAAVTRGDTLSCLWEGVDRQSQGAGFKDKDKALETIKLLEGRDISFQFQVINSMYHRAKVILKRTKDAEKVQNLTEAIETFQVWLDDYRAHSRAKENFTYLPLETVEAYERLAEKYGVSQAVNNRPSFLQVYKAAEGELKKLRMAKVDPDDEQTVTWDVHRNKNLRDISERIKSDHLPLYETDVEFRGLPTKEHVELIMWGYSSEPTKVKKCVSLIEEKLGVTNEDSEKLGLTNGGSEKLSVASEGSETIDTSDEEIMRLLVVEIYIFPPDNPLLSDEDSGNEKEGFMTSVVPSRVDEVVPKPLYKRIGGTRKPVVARPHQP
uniref:Uncharacterized protein n=1 Tax=Timema cristinae TaxID=61476 RepID=A0A7R9CF41_TIMCR|nr:unnamed protein product [Timema cristinae]